MDDSSDATKNAWFAVPIVTFGHGETPRQRATTRPSYVHVETGPEADARLEARGHWVGAHLRTGLTLPMVVTVVRFEEAEMVIVPATAELLPAIFYRTDDDAIGSSQRIVQRFISALNWMNPSFGEIRLEWTAGGRPVRHSNRPLGGMLTHSFYQEWLPQNLEPHQRLALALYREGSSLSHPGYQFLSFYKVINLKHRTGKAQKAWISQNLSAIDDSRAVERIDELRNELGLDNAIADYLYVSCRCAVAHAGIDEPTIDPEDPEDRNRLWKDLPLIRSLAEHLIRTDFGIPNRSDVWRKNAIALEGARLLLGDEVSDRITQKQLVLRSEIKLPKAVDVRVWGKPQLRAFAAMRLRTRYSENGMIELRLCSAGDAIELSVVLDFARNKVVFEPIQDMTWDDDGSAQAADDIADAFTLRRDVFGNGMIELWDREAGLCIAQGDAYMPMNMYLDFKQSEAELQRIRAIAEQRRSTESANRVPVVEG